MQIKYDKKVESNIDLTQEKELRIAILNIVQHAIKNNHLDSNIASANGLYTNEIIQLVFRTVPSGFNNNLLIITNYRLLHINQSILTNILHGDSTDNRNLKENVLFINLNSCQDNFYQGNYSLVLQYGNTKQLIIDSEIADDSLFIRNKIKPLVLKNNEEMVEAYNRMLDLEYASPFDISSIEIDPNEEPIQNIVNKNLKIDKTKEIKKAKQNEKNSAPDSKNSTKQNIATNPNCQYSFGPAPKGYHLIDVIYVQGETINWISNNGNFNKAMDKAFSELASIINPDEFVCNLKFTTQNMGDTFAVNLAGDLYKKD